MSKSVPYGWTFKTINDIASVFAGGTPSRSKPEYYSGNIPWVKSGEVNARQIFNTSEHISKLAVEESSARMAPSGSVLLAMYGATAGQVAKLMVDATLNQAVSAINAKPDIAHNDYLIYTFEFNTEELLNTAQGSGQPNLSGQLIKGLKVLLPPLTEQQKIAQILTSVDEVIEKTQAQIDKLKDLKTAMMQELLTKGIGHFEFKDSAVGRIPVGWEVVELENLVNTDKNITYGIVQAGPHCDGGIPYIRVSDMNSRHLNREGMLLTAPAIAEKFKRSAVSTGDIVYALRGMIGHVHMVPSQLDGANLTQGTARISPCQTINSNYLLWAMKSPYVAVQNDLEAKGSTFREVTLASLRKIKVCVPTIDEQQKIVSVLEGIDEKTFAVQDKLTLIKSIKKALMQDLLTGKVRVCVNE
jgi:type I restriction enzyme S subunit